MPCTRLAVGGSGTAQWMKWFRNPGCSTVRLTGHRHTQLEMVSRLFLLTPLHFFSQTCQSWKQFGFPLFFSFLHILHIFSKNYFCHRCPYITIYGYLYKCVHYKTINRASYVFIKGNTTKISPKSCLTRDD